MNAIFRSKLIFCTLYCVFSAIVIVALIPVLNIVTNDITIIGGIVISCFSFLLVYLVKLIAQDNAKKVFSWEVPLRYLGFAYITIGIFTILTSSFFSAISFMAFGCTLIGLQAKNKEVKCSQ